MVRTISWRETVYPCRKGCRGSKFLLLAKRKTRVRKLMVLVPPLPSLFSNLLVLLLHLFLLFSVGSISLKRKTREMKVDHLNYIGIPVNSRLGGRFYPNRLFFLAYANKRFPFVNPLVLGRHEKSFVGIPDLIWISLLCDGPDFK